MMDEDANDKALVDAWMRRLAQAPLSDSSHVRPAVLWWRAQLESRRDAERREHRRIERGENLMIALGSAAALFVVAWTWVTPTSRPLLVAAAAALASTLISLAPHVVTRIANRR
jgi:Flp pilus assembly protein TadB